MAPAVLQHAPSLHTHRQTFHGSSWYSVLSILRNHFHYHLMAQVFMEIHQKRASPPLKNLVVCRQVAHHMEIAHSPSWLKLVLSSILRNHFHYHLMAQVFMEIHQKRPSPPLKKTWSSANRQVEWNPVARSYLLPLFSTNHHHDHHAPITTNPEEFNISTNANPSLSSYMMQ